ncbi:hypothetical protein FXO37_26083 [Capsicum annuum]|nr:hypothetical protein FXO37_26083 [Capsicum annuum]
MISNHPSTGAFMTHYGSNSTMESFIAGVPMLIWSLLEEQFYNEKLVKTLGCRVGVGAEGLGPSSYPIHNLNLNSRPNTDPNSVSFHKVSKLLNLPLSDVAQSLV